MTISHNLKSSFVTDFNSIERLSHQMVEKSEDDNSKIKFILCHAGTNTNGVHFSKEELLSTYKSAIGTKINLKHSQNIDDIVGGITISEYFDTNEPESILCTGELFIEESEKARLALRLIKHGIIKQVSMECSYEKGQCSICGLEFTNRSNMCSHLRQKGIKINGDKAYEIMHGVKFTGVALLDKEGADKEAKIVNTSHSDINGDNKILDKKQVEQAESENSITQEKEEQLEILKKENISLKKQIDSFKTEIIELKNKISKLQNEQKAIACLQKSKGLIVKMENKGLVINSENELERLSKLSDEAFNAVKLTIENLPEKKEQNITSASKNKPKYIDDTEKSLQERLGEKFEKIWKNNR